MRSIFCGNFEFGTRQSELERLFRRYGKVDRVDIKSGFAFVYMDDERDAEDAIRGLDRMEFGRKGRRLRVEWSKFSITALQEDRSRRPESSRKSSSTSRTSKTLFVINFDPYNTRTRDLERHFDPYGKVLNIRIRKNFAFVHYELQEDATRALDATHMSKLMDRVITVEYAIKDDDDRRNRYSPGRNRDRSPRRGNERDLSFSPYGRERASPDYGRSQRRNPSPYGRDQRSPDYGHGSSPSRHKERNSEHGRGDSPGVRKERNPTHGNGRERGGPENGRESSPLEGGCPDRGNKFSPRSPKEKGEICSPDGYRGGNSPSSKPEVESPERYRSRSPPCRERSPS